MIKPTSRAIDESEIREMENEVEKSNSDCGVSKSQVTTTEIVSENIDDIGQETKKVRKVKLERQSSKDNSRRTRFAKCTKDESETAVSNNIRSRRLKRETSSQSILKYEEGKDKKSSTNSGVQSEDVLGAEALKLHITEPTEEVARRQEDSKVDLEASLVTETTSQCSTDVNRRSQIVAATGTSDPVDVFVPTTRKIFSPVRRDSKGKASSVISYIVRENPPPDQVPLSPRRVRRRNEQEEKTKLQNKNVEEDDENRRDNFVLPPCWILRETRAQSASPALQRRNFPVPRSREKQAESDPTPNTRKNVEFKIEDGDHISSHNTPVTDDSLVPKPGENSRVQENKFGNYGTPTSPTPPTPPLAKKYSVPNRENLSSESTDKNSSEMKPQPIRKSRTEIGFPPISPIPGRREVKLSKETAPSIRMIIARYNQKVSESQEMLGSKSPDSGSGSPLPWRSPGAERRVRVQMEKYQDEVRRALQGSEGRKHNFSGEVKKSASASFIRSFDKGSVQDRFGRRPSDSLSERQTSEMRYNGILKSSSAGSIKPGTPVPQRREAATLEKLETTTNIPPSQSTVPPALDPPSPENRVLDEDISTIVTPTVIPTSETKCIEENMSKVCSVERTGSRALRIKKAKEEFLSRGPGGTWSTNANVKTDSSNMSSTSEEGWSQTKNRLSRVSCESEASCEGILVSGEEHRQPFDSRLLVKSASAGMINIDSLSFGSILPESTSNSSVPSGSSEQGAGSSKSRFALSNIASRFRKVKMRRHKEKERDKMETVSTLCRQSLLVDIQKRKAADKRDKVSSKSCPSSPVLQKRESNSSWSISPRRIFKPK
ncbi:hypothetical protein LSTR_LSTR008299 [Laodelphax striatellus]|uniref:Uncharacterized protein n=1 Tax=Laodelphax striatellus TaxID=195883 RepID=A0A482XJH4_LAOST|nr:hypothetical protein LSTR_LSTR008299 [Laodelphax striatellus]